LVYDNSAHNRTLASTEYTIVSPEGYDTSVAGNYVFTVKFNEDLTIVNTFTVVVASPVPESITLDTSAVNLTLDNGGTLNTAGLVVTLVYDNGSDRPLASTEYTVVPPQGYDTSVAGNYVFTVKLNEDLTITKTFTVTVSEDTAKGDTPDTDTDPGSGGCKNAAAILITVLGLAVTVVLRIRKKR
jgi:uncharacterized membrane protein